jgi:hypothetical protein
MRGNVPTYFPIDAGVAFDCDRSDLLKVHWEVDALTADFRLPSIQDRVLRVSFARETIIRILDEFPLSTEYNAASVKGLVANHFAYRLEGATFAAMQSEPWRENGGAVEHYQFVTGAGCMDVLCATEPRFEVVTLGS